MSSIFSTSSPLTPVSSRTSRSAASAADSPGSMWPFGRASTLPSFTRTAATNGRPRMVRTTTPPAENSRRSGGRSASFFGIALLGLGLHEGHEAHRYHGLATALGVVTHQALVASAADRAYQYAVR